MIILMDAILQLSQLNEFVEITREPIDLLELAEHVLVQLQQKADEKQVRLSVVGEAIVYPANRWMMTSLLFYLCENAIKYNVVESQHGEDIFERFYRGDKSRSEKFEGTGLGLSIVKHVLLLHKDKIEVKSEVGKGTTMRVLLPKN